MLWPGGRCRRMRQRRWGMGAALRGLRGRRRRGTSYSCSSDAP